MWIQVSLQAKDFRFHPSKPFSGYFSGTFKQRNLFWEPGITVIQDNFKLEFKCQWEVIHGAESDIEV